MNAKPNNLIWETKKRDIKFDLMRIIGLAAIILAHTSPPWPISQLRNFDVPLMVIVSGAVFGLSSNNKINYFHYLIGRTARLLLPTYIFLIIFFVGYL